jgi:hypothetical protein
MRSRCCLCVRVSSSIVARKRLGKYPLIVARQRLAKNPLIVATRLHLQGRIRQKKKNSMKAGGKQRYLLQGGLLLGLFLQITRSSGKN